MKAIARRGSFRCGQSVTGRGRTASRRFRPGVCGLEERQLLSTFIWDSTTYTWDSTTGGAFNNAQNWVDQDGRHGVPGAADTAIIKGSGFTVSVDEPTIVGSLSSAAQVAINSGALALDGYNRSSSIASLALAAGTTLAVDSGTLSLTGSSTFAGNLYAAGGSSIDFTGGEQVVDSGAVFFGSGSFAVENGTAGSWVVNSSITAPANFSLVDGTIDLVGRLTIPGQFSWTGGTLGGASDVVVAWGATLDIDTTATSLLQNDAILRNDGTVVWSEAGGEILGAGTIDNYGMFSIVGQNPLQQAYSDPIDGSFDNAGTLVVNGALPTIDLVTSTGRIDVTNDGYLTIAGNSTISGIINTAAGATLSFFGSLDAQGNYMPGVATIEPGTAFDGSGSYAVFDGETMCLDTHVAPAYFVVAGGTVTGPGCLTVPGELEFSGGEIAPAVVSVPAGATFNIDNYYRDPAYGWTLAAGTVNLGGVTVWKNANAGDLVLGSSTTVNNRSGAVFEIETDVSMVGGTFNNSGTIVKELAPGGVVGYGSTTILTTLNNTGNLSVDSGILYLAGTVSQVSGVVLTGGSWSVVNATGVGAILDISSAGGIATIGPGASVALDGLYTSFTNLISLSVNEGDFSLLGGQAFETPGSLSNYGNIELGAGDTLGVNGNYGQASNAWLGITIGGTSSSSLVGHLDVADDAYFGGVLDIIASPGFVPVYNDQYELLTYGHVSSYFGGIASPTFADGEYFSITYGGQFLSLRVR